MGGISLPRDGNVCEGAGLNTSDMSGLYLALASVPGITALVGSWFWLGRLSQRMTTVERDLADLKDIKAEVATIGERTKHTDDNVKGVAGDLRLITRHLLDESRTFAREIITKEQQRRGSSQIG